MRWRSHLPVVMLTLIVAAAVYYAVDHHASQQHSIPVQVVCLVAALAWVAFFGRRRCRSIARSIGQELSPYPVWLLVVLALALRIVSLTYLPPPEQTGFEELQTGSVSYSLIESRSLAIEFRYTNLLGAVGFLLGDVPSLAWLRFGFQVTGCLGLILIVLCLRALKVGWLPTLVVVFTAATLRWLVLAGGVAEETFTGVSVVAALLWLLVKAGESEGDGPFWASAAGVCAGILMYEYTSYRVGILLGIAWLGWTAVFPLRGREHRTRWSGGLPLLCFLVALCLVAMPTIIETVRDPGGSVFLEAFRRHGGERATVSSAKTLEYVKQHALSLLGRPSHANLYMTPVGEPVIPPLAGCLFALAFVSSVVAPRHMIERAMAVIVLLTVVAGAATANNLNIVRVSPALPMLLVMMGIALDNAQQWVSRLGERISRGRSVGSPGVPRGVPAPVLQSAPSDANLPSSPPVPDAASGWRRRARPVLTYAVVVLYVGLAVQLSRVNLEATRRMAADPAVIDEYANDDYTVCSHIGRVARPGQRVYIYSPDRHWLCPREADQAWLYPGLGLEIHPVASYDLDQNSHAPGDLVVVGVRSRGLRDDELAKLLVLADATGSRQSLQTTTNIAGRTAAASICIQAE